jgi:hypothetical protein
MRTKPPQTAPSRLYPRCLWVLSVFVGLAASVGLGLAIDWVGNYLIPGVVVLGVIVGVFGLAAWGLAKLYDKHEPPW